MLHLYVHVFTFMHWSMRACAGPRAAAGRRARGPRHRDSQALSGQKPFAGQDSDRNTIFFALQNDRVPFFVEGTVSAGTADVVTRALQKDLNARYKTAAEMAGELKQATEMPVHWAAMDEVCLLAYRAFVISGISTRATRTKRKQEPFSIYIFPNLASHTTDHPASTATYQNSASWCFNGNDIGGVCQWNRNMALNHHMSVG